MAFIVLRIPPLIYPNQVFARISILFRMIVSQPLDSPRKLDHSICINIEPCKCLVRKQISCFMEDTGML
jgi:hypothetical protein